MAYPSRRGCVWRGCGIRRSRFPLCFAEGRFALVYQKGILIPEAIDNCLHGIKQIRCGCNEAGVCRMIRGAVRSGGPEGANDMRPVRYMGEGARVFAAVKSGPRAGSVLFHIVLFDFVRLKRRSIWRASHSRECLDDFRRIPNCGLPHRYRRAAQSRTAKHWALGRVRPFGGLPDLQKENPRRWLELVAEMYLSFVRIAG